MTGLQDSFTSLAQPGLLTILIWKGLVDTLHFEQLVGHKQTNTFAIRNNRQSCGLPPTPVNSRRKVGASALPRSTVPDCAFAECLPSAPQSRQLRIRCRLCLRGKRGVGKQGKNLGVEITHTHKWHSMTSVEEAAFLKLLLKSGTVGECQE